MFVKPYLHIPVPTKGDAATASIARLAHLYLDNVVGSVNYSALRTNKRQSHDTTAHGTTIMKTNLKCVLSCVVSGLLPLGIITNALASPTVSGNIISWPDNGWYQVQNASTFASVCEGGSRCDVADGNYIVINHTLGERFELILVPASIAPEPGDEDTTSGVSVADNVISWPDDGWYQVQNADTFESICEGGRSCTVADGSYNIINLDSGLRFENIAVPDVVGDGESPTEESDSGVSEPDVDETPDGETGSGDTGVEGIVVAGNVINWPAGDWFQVQNATTYASICEGGVSCEAPDGIYTVINLSSGERFENIVVPNGEDSDIPTNPLDGIGTVQRVGPAFGFLEGPAYRSSDGSLYFSDIPADTIYRVLADGSIVPFQESQPTNGLAFDNEDRLLVATQNGRTLVRLDASGNTTLLADRFDGALLNSPNDIALHDNGDVYFTDPPYGIDPATSEVGCAGVYRLTADASLSRFWCNGIETRPNGIALSPSQDRLYVSFTLSGQILSWPVAADGSVGEVETFATTASGADGMAIDAAGNLFITSAAGVEVFAPDGTRWGVIEVPEQPANCALGGPDAKTLYITARTGLYTVAIQ